jgi:hypothetical protein
MTSPSPKSHPTTRPNTPRSTVRARIARCTGIILAATLVANAWPGASGTASAQDYGRRRTGPPQLISAGQQQARPGQLASRATPPKAVQRMPARQAAPRQMPARQAAAQPAQPSATAAAPARSAYPVRTAGYREPSGRVAVRGTIRQVSNENPGARENSVAVDASELNSISDAPLEAPLSAVESDALAQSDIVPEPRTRARPFKKISDIMPYFDYEPDHEIASRDRCFNLCPRPQDAGCPECDPSDPNCPECPVDLDLRTASHDGTMATYQPRNFAHIHYCWEPSNLYHYPLYFEDFALERYGHSRHALIQPFFSAARFATQFVGLPYQMSIDPICKERYTLGWYRPGACVPHMYYQVPWNTQAALTEAGVLTGAYFLFAPGVGP